MPFSGFEWMLALRYLRARRKEGALSVIAGFSFLGIVLGVTTMIVVLAVMNGFREELIDKFLGINGHVLVYPPKTDTTSVEGLHERISGLDGVQSAFPFVEGAALASTRHAGRGVVIRGLRSEDLRNMDSLNVAVKFGSLEDFGKKKGIVLGTRLAEKIGVFVGSRVSLLIPGGVSTPFGVAPRVASYEVLSLFELGMPEYDSSLVFMPFEEAQSFLGGKKKDFVFEVSVDDVNQVDRYRDALQNALGSEFYLIDWRQRNRSLFDALELERNVMFLILMQIVFVAMMNIVSGLIMLVKDKGTEIGLLRAMGATRGSVMRVFFIVGSSIGTMGTLVGLVIGLLVCQNMEFVQVLVSFATGSDSLDTELTFLSRLPVRVDFRETFFVVLFSLFLSFLATLYPSWRAARLDPAEALRYG